jgi:hypothetical protein
MSGPASLSRKELILLWRIGTNARFWESSQFLCSEAVGHIGRLGLSAATCNRHRRGADGVGITQVIFRTRRV